MKKQIIPFLFITLILVSCNSQSEKESQLLQERISKVENGLQPNLQIKGDSIPFFNIESRMEQLGIPGVSIAMLKNGEIEWAKGYGMADKSENRKVTPETMFLAASISKPVTAIRALQLAESGKIDLDSNVNNYLSSWKLPDNEFTATEKVTTRRILNHTAGLTVSGFPGYLKGDSIPDVIGVLDGKGNTDPVRVYQEPGKSWMYSGGGYTLLQLMIMDIDGKSFPETMQKNVLSPLEINASTFENPLPEKYHKLAATGYRANGNEVKGKWPIYPEMAAAGLWTTPSQLIMWAKEIQQIYQKQEDRILKKEMVNEMLTAGQNDHGLGPGVHEHFFGHDGGDEGFRSKLVAWKDKPYAVVIMVNSDNGSIMQEIMLSIVRAYDLPGFEPIVFAVEEQSKEKLMRFEGVYELPGLGNAQISVKENGLELTAAFIETPAFLLPESEFAFFEKGVGDYVEFIHENGEITGFSVKGLKATKIE